MPTDINYPALWVIGLVLLMTTAAALLTRRFGDQPGVFFGLLVIMALIGAVAYSLVSPVPESEVGGLLIGTLISAFTLVMGWLYSPHRRNPEETTMPHPHEDEHDASPKHRPRPEPLAGDDDGKNGRKRAAHRRSRDS